LPAFWK